MEENRCSFFTFLNGNVFAAILHFICAASVWCSPVFPILPVCLFCVEEEPTSRVACMHTAVISVVNTLLAAIPVLLWLIIKAITKSHGAVFVILTVLIGALLAFLALFMIAVEITCGIKSLRGERVEVPIVTPIVAWIAKKWF